MHFMCRHNANRQSTLKLESNKSEMEERKNAPILDPKQLCIGDSIAANNLSSEFCNSVRNRGRGARLHRSTV